MTVRLRPSRKTLLSALKLPKRDGVLEVIDDEGKHYKDVWTRKSVERAVADAALPPGYVAVPLELLERLAPEDPMNQDEMGGCVWCAGDGGKRYGDAGRDPADHNPDCPWVAARALMTTR